MLKEPISKDEIFTAGRFVYQSTRLDVTAALVDVTRSTLSTFKKEFIKRGELQKKGCGLSETSRTSVGKTDKS